MYKSSLIQDLDKALNIKFDVICQIFDVILTRFSEFFYVVQHKSGDILQIQLKKYN